jgi:hypothetical protein
MGSLTGTAFAQQAAPTGEGDVAAAAPAATARSAARADVSEQQLQDVVGPNRVKGRRTRLAQVATTSGTGSEAGIRALVTDAPTHAKMAVESPHMLADIAILDPELTYSVPPAVTAATGIDALAHCVEAFTNVKAHDLIDFYARAGMRLVGQYLPRSVVDGRDTEARAGMMLASYYGGLCLGPVNTAARIGEHSAVVWKLAKRRPPAARRSNVGVAMSEPKQPSWPNPRSSRSTTTTFGAPSGGRKGCCGAYGGVCSRTSVDVAGGYCGSGIGRWSRLTR